MGGKDIQMSMEIEQESGISIFAAAGFEKYREAWWRLQGRKLANRR